MSSEDDHPNGDDLPPIEPFDEKQLTDATERLIKRSVLIRRVRYASAFVIGIGLGAIALYSIGQPRGTSVDRTLVASAAFANLMGNEKEIRITATGGKGRFGIAVGFRGDGPVVELNPGTGKHTRFGGPNEPATFLLPEAVNSIYLVVTDTPAEDVVRRFFGKRLEPGASIDEPARAMEKLQEHLLSLGYNTLDIHKVNKP